MTTDETFQQLSTIRLHGLARTPREQLESPGSFDHLGFDERGGLLVDSARGSTCTSEVSWGDVCAHCGGHGVRHEVRTFGGRRPPRWRSWEHGCGRSGARMPCSNRPGVLEAGVGGVGE